MFEVCLRPGDYILRRLAIDEHLFTIDSHSSCITLSFDTAKIANDVEKCKSQKRDGFLECKMSSKPYYGDANLILVDDLPTETELKLASGFSPLYLQCNRHFVSLLVGHDSRECVRKSITRGRKER